MACLVLGSQEPGKKQQQLRFHGSNSWQVAPKVYLVWTVRTSFRLFLASYNVPLESLTSSMLGYVVAQWSNRGFLGKEGARQGRLRLRAEVGLTRCGRIDELGAV